MSGAVTAALVVTAGAAAYSAVEAKKARKDQASANAKAEKRAQEAQDAQAELAAEEEATAAEKLKDQQARLVRGRQGRGGLLFGSELGVQDGTDDAKASTLGG